MNKKGQVDPITLTIGIIILAGVLISGYIGTKNAIEDTRYLFDPITNTTYDLLKCKSTQLPDTAQIRQWYCRSNERDTFTRHRISRRKGFNRT